MDQRIGKILGNRYEILERIGSGGMAVVYKAKCHWLNRFVAIKILKDDLAQDEEFRRRFHEESQAVAMLSHPNIVSIYDVSRAEDTAEPDYIVMELIEGITLKQYMQKKGGQLSWKESLHFITQIMKGLSHAHSRGIIHRDIKPHNIMVLRDGSVKVADFGIARLMSNAQNTMTQEALGSVHYISPEQARGSRIDARSDIYSAGVVLYEMLTGRLPYEGDSPVAVAIQHINSIPLSPREIDNSLPEALEEITMKAMAPDTNKRYLTADAMLADLEEFRKNPNISFDYTSEDLLTGDGDEPTQPIGANPPQIAHIRSAHTHTGGRAESSFKSRTEVEDEEDDYEEDGGSGAKGIVIAAVVVLLCLAGIGYFLWVNVFSGMMATGETIAVPDIKGYTVEEAKALPEILDGNFIIIVGKEIETEDVPAGQIVNQSPNANDMVKAGAHEITVDVSVNKEGLTMPDCYNRDQRIVVSDLRSLGVEVEVKEDFSDDITKGKVMAQEPAAEQPLEVGETVSITVSKGPEPKPVAMISVVGISQEEATRLLTGMGLRVGTVKPMPSEEYGEGLICYQSVAANTDVFEDSVIDLGISTGAEAVEPPDVSPTPEPTNPPEPSQPVTGTVSRKEGTVELPNDRETVVVRVTVGGEEKYKAEFNTTVRRARYTVTGSGTQEIVVYIDDVEVKRYTEDFDA